MSGWLSLYRGWRDCEAFEERSSPMADCDAWLWLIENAAWKAFTRRGPKGDPIRLERGQIHVSDRQLAGVFLWDKKRVRRFLDRLEGHEMVSQNRDHSGTILTICNYDKYQNHDEDAGPSKDHHGTTQEQGKQGKEEKLAARAGEIDVPSLMMRLCRAARIMPPDPGRNFAHHTEVLSLVEGWITAGADPDKMEQCVAARTASMPSPPRSLKYFDQPVRATIAAQAAQATEADRMIAQIRARKAA